MPPSSMESDSGRICPTESPVASLPCGYLSNRPEFNIRFFSESAEHMSIMIARFFPSANTRLPVRWSYRHTVCAPRLFRRPTSCVLRGGMDGGADRWLTRRSSASLPSASALSQRHPSACIGEWRTPQDACDACQDCQGCGMDMGKCHTARTTRHIFQREPREKGEFAPCPSALARECWRGPESSSCAPGAP